MIRPGSERTRSIGDGRPSCRCYCERLVTRKADRIGEGQLMARVEPVAPPTTANEYSRPLVASCECPVYGCPTIDLTIVPAIARFKGVTQESESFRPRK
jgi:hypothetical protein